jgi:uncharacterized protein
MTPFQFGPPGRRLFGIHYRGAVAQAGVRASAVLLCNPFGQEAVRSHRMFRLLSERLARAGHDVLRFDYYGTGDSMGDDLDGDLAGWAGDVHEADRELHVRSGSKRTVWIGMRLGAAVALRAAKNAPDGLARLVLWDPVLDGGRYLQHLRERHVASLEEAFSLPPVPAPAQLARNPANFVGEAIGFALPAPLREQVAALRLPDHRWPARPASIVVLTDPSDVDGCDLVAVCAREPGRVQTVVVSHGTDWTSDTAENGALISAPALAQLIQQAGAPA